MERLHYALLSLVQPASGIPYTAHHTFVVVGGGGDASAMQSDPNSGFFGPATVGS